MTSDIRENVRFAHEALATYRDENGPDQHQDNVVDLLADLMHYCVAHRVGFQKALRLARDHFRAERRGED